MFKKWGPKFQTSHTQVARQGPGPCGVLIVLNEISAISEPNHDSGRDHALFEQSLGPLFLARFASRRWVGRKIEVRPRENGCTDPTAGGAPGSFSADYTTRRT